FEGDEAFTVTLSNASTGSEITGASAAGTIQNDDTLPPAGPIVLIDEDFDGPGDTGGFAYEDGNFGGGNPQAYADGTWNGGALTLNLGGIDNTTVTDISGGWTASFTLDTESEVSLSFLYEMIHAEGYEDDEFSQVLVSIDGGPPVLVSTLTGDGNGGGAQTTGPQTFSAALGVLAAGDHSLTIGGLNNKKTWANETTDVLVDDVLLTAVPQDPSPPVVTSYTIDPLNAVQTEGDDGATAFTFTVTRSGDLTGSGSVEFSIAGSEAGADDFLGGLLPGGSVTFAADEVSRTIVIEVAGDTDFETDEDFVVTLSNPSAGSEIAIASAAGTILNDDTAPVGPVTLLDARFDTAGDTAGFVYRDGSFGGPGFQSNADGDWDSGRLAINLGGGGNTTTLDLSGAWEVGFTVTAEMDVVLAFDYELIMSAFYEADEFSQALVSLNDGAPILVDQLVGDGNGGSDDTSGLQSALLDLGRLAAGDYSLAIGAYNNKKTWANETTELTIDDVLVTGSLPAGSDVDLSATLIGSNLSDPSITETELQAVAGF
ncbi:Calx-beta domain-containing protein, partial [Pelagibius sp.]|uniref:Calx-beta domain-containing protein n=1 Tax=Pelagibius sp. TaxID=1931238 RepID=UPI002612E51F